MSPDSLQTDNYTFIQPMSYRFSQPIYNICNPTDWNMAQTLSAQLSANTAAQFPLYQIPSFNYSSMGNSYASTDLNSVFCNIMNRTMQQFNWQMNNGGGFNFGFNNGFNFGGQNWWQPNNGNSNSNLTAEEKTAKTQFTKLQNLISSYKNTHTITDDALRNEIETALKKDSKDNYTQAYEKLKAVYVKLNKKDAQGLKNTLLLLDKEVKDGSGNVIAHNYKKDLANGGYDYNNLRGLTGAPKAAINVDDLHSKVSAPKLVSGKHLPSGDAYSELSLSTSGNDNNILAVLGEWNNTYNTSKEKSIIRIFTNKIIAKGIEYTKSPCADYIDGNLVPFTDALRHKGEYDAENLKHLSSEERENLKNLSHTIATDVTRIKKSGNNKDKLKASLNKLVKDFDKLYVALRIAEAKNTREAIKEDYAFLNDVSSEDTNIINNERIVKATVADLKREGFSDIEIKNCGIKADISTATPQSENSSDNGEITKENISEHSEYKEITNPTLIMSVKKAILQRKKQGDLKDVNSRNIGKIYKKGNEGFIFVNDKLTKVCNFVSKNKKTK